MTADVRELLPLYALGILEGDEARVVEAALAADPLLVRELDSLVEASTALAAPVAPSADVERRLLASIGAGPLERFSGSLARLFDVTVDRARELLGLIERPASWEPGAPGLTLVHFSGGPAHATADCGFIRLDPGAGFPIHKHQGEEVSLILAGRLRDRTTGRVYEPGDELVEGTSADHDVVCDGDLPCIYAARVTDGITIGGMPVRPTKK